MNHSGHSNHAGGRSSYRKSARGPSRSQNGDTAEERLQVIIDGVDRTPKPLLSLRPTVLKGGPGDDSNTPNSDTSEFFMDRMSAAFSRAGWFSNADSGTHTPKSEADYDYEGWCMHAPLVAGPPVCERARRAIGNDAAPWPCAPHASMHAHTWR